MTTNQALTLVARELKRAQKQFAPMHSYHEGWAVIREEVDELWEEVKHGTTRKAREEAVQVAAMGLRFLVDLCGPPVSLRDDDDGQREGDEQ